MIDVWDIAKANAEADDGSEIAKRTDYFKTADPEDISQGDLSARIHFWKCEEGGGEDGERKPRTQRQCICRLVLSG